MSSNYLLANRIDCQIIITKSLENWLQVPLTCDLTMEVEESNANVGSFLSCDGVLMTVVAALHMHVLRPDVLTRRVNSMII